MRSFVAFTKKEIMESVRTYKFMILFLIFVVFGFLNPVMAKVLPEILESVLPEGMTITLEEPKAIDSWMQFFKNGAQTGMIVLTVIFSGIMAGEISKGTLIHMVTKGLSRKVVVLSKFTSAVLQWTLSYAVSTLITLGYTLYFFEEMELPNLFLGIIGMWIFGVLLLSMVIFGGLLFKNVYGALLLAGGVAMILTSSCGIGFKLSADLLKRIEELKVLKKIILMLRGEIKYNNSTMSEAFETISNRIDNPYKTFLGEASKELNSLSGKTFVEIWRFMIDKNLAVF